MILIIYCIITTIYILFFGVLLEENDAGIGKIPATIFCNLVRGSHALTHSFPSAMRYCVGVVFRGYIGNLGLLLATKERERDPLRMYFVGVTIIVG